MTAPLLQIENADASELSAIMRLACDRLDINFVANRVLPGIAEFPGQGEGLSSGDRLNLLGRSFGLRFREMRGSYFELESIVKNSGPVVLGVSSSSGNELTNPALVLDESGGPNFSVYHGGQQSTVNSVALKNLVPNSQQEFTWYLVSPMLAAETASSFHYQTGTSEAPLRPLQRYLAMLKPEAEDIRSIVIFSIVVGLLGLTTPLAVEAIVNTIAFGRYLQPLIVLSLIVLVFLGFLAGLNVLMTVVTEIIQRKLFVRTVEDLSYRLTRVPIQTFRKYHGPELVNRFFDVMSIQKITSKLFLDTLMLGLQTVIGLTVLAFYHPFLLGYDIGLLAMMTIVLRWFGRGAVKSAVKESELKYETAAWLQEIVRHPSTFKYNGGLGYAINRADNLTSQYIQQRQDHFRILIRQISFAMTMQVIAATVLLALGGYLVIDGQMTLGQLVAAELIVTVILGSFAKIGKDLESFYDLMAAVDKVGKLFDLPVESFDRMQLARRPGAYGMSMVNVRFDEFDEYEHSIEFPAGHSYAIYSSNELRRGHLIEAFVGQTKPLTGHFLLDNFRVDALSAESLQEKISMVKEIEIFAGSVDDNIRLCRPHIGSHQMNEIVQVMGLRKTIAGLPEGYKTELCISGYPLSQGEAIRLVLARSLVANPAVLFVDGLLDRLSDDDTTDVLERLAHFRGQTTMVISTGRKVIARWAEECMEIDRENWQLAKFSG